MKILQAQSNQLSANQQVNKIGNYLYRTLDGAFKFKRSSNQCDVYVTVLYQLPRAEQVPGKGKEYNDVHEMTVDINITTYLNKVRINLLNAETGRCLSYLLLASEQLMDLESAKRRILQKVRKVLSHEFCDYNFLF